MRAREVLCLAGVLIIGAFSAPARAAPVTVASARLAIDAIEPWRNSLEYSEEGWNHLLDTARQLQALAPEAVADILREQQKSWTPKQQWDYLIQQYRPGVAQDNDKSTPTPEAISNAYREYAKLRFSAADAQDLNPSNPWRDAGSYADATKVFLLLRVMFDLPERSRDEEDPVIGKFRFMTAPHYFGRYGNEAWPLAWSGGRPHLIAPVFLYKGPAYNAVEDYRRLLSQYPLRNLDALAPVPSARSATPVQSNATPPLDPIMTAVGLYAYNQLSTIYPAVNYSSCQLEPLKKLLDAGADPNSRDIADWTALMYASATGRLGCMDLLLKKGANPNAENLIGETPLMLSAEPRSVFSDAKSGEDVTMLLLAGSKVDAQDGAGRTAFLHAAGHLCVECMKVLLAHGANINHRDELGQTALMYAISDNHYDVPQWADPLPAVQFLLAHGIDVQARTIWGKTALTRAREMRAKSVAKAIQDAGGKD